MIISLIAAVDENFGIGQAGKIPWKLSTDLKRFKAITMGHHVIMGRKTYQSIGRNLPGRIMIVLSRQSEYRPQGIFVASSIVEAINFAENCGETEAFIIGGGNIFQQSLHMADRLYLTHVHTAITADVYFPKLDNNWKLIASEFIPVDDQNEYPSNFCIYERA